MKKDVIANCPYILTEVTGIKNANGECSSIKLVLVFSIDVGGSLPDFVKRKIAEEQALDMLKLVDFIKANYKK